MTGISVAAWDFAAAGYGGRPLRVPEVSDNAWPRKRRRRRGASE